MNMIGEDEVVIWDQSDVAANNLLRSLIQQARYPWVYRKLNNARWHIIETHTRKVPLDRTTRNIVTNGDAF